MPSDGAVSGDGGQDGGSGALDGGADASVDPSLDPATWIEPVRPTLPPAPAWAPEFPVTGNPGWGSSTTPVCVDDTGKISAWDVFVDANAVYVRSLVYNNVFDLGSPWAGRPSGQAIHRNDGSGWARRLWAPTDYSLFSADGMIANAAGDLFVAGLGSSGRVACGVTRIAHGPLTAAGVTCQLQTDGWLPRLFLAPGDRPFALMSSEILTYAHATGWSKRFELPSGMPSDLWTDGAAIVVGGSDQTAFVVDSAGLHDLTNDIPLGSYGAVWGFGPGDAWFGSNHGELLHYDGTSFTSVPTGLAGCPDAAFQALWGHGTTLYFLTSRAFGRIDGGTVERFVDLPCDAHTTFRDLDGTVDGSRIVLSLVDPAYTDYACGSTFLVWFDGHDFHRF